MKCDMVFFASEKYWKDRVSLEESCEIIASQVGETGTDEKSGRYIVTTERELAQILPVKGTLLIAVVLSGSVQTLLAAAAEAYEYTILYAAYVKGNVPAELSSHLLYQNCAPAVMDVWSVLRRKGPKVRLAVNKEDMIREAAVFSACGQVRNSKLLLIGNTEPWVISSSREPETYERLFGVTIERVDQEELAKAYERTDREKARPYYERYFKGASQVVEPSNDDIWNACRMASALYELMSERGAKGGAIACFDLLKTGINTCLGVSFVNEHTDMSVACEGDLDSACTMLMMKQLAKTNLFMGNPSLSGDKTINFSHCTAPCSVSADGLNQYSLRNHHESGIGVSLQVEFPVGTQVTACRISGETGQATIHTGLIVEREYEACCRTQIHVELERYDHYIRTSLGCHQVLAFEDMKAEMEALFCLFGLEIL